MALRPQRPSQVDLGPGFGGSVEGSRLGTYESARSPSTTFEIHKGDILYRAVALDLARDAGRLGVHVGILVGLVVMSERWSGLKK